jgi:glutathione peroxidase
MFDRRTILASLLAATTIPAWMRGADAQAAMTGITAYAFSFPALAGGDIRLNMPGCSSYGVNFTTAA